MPAFGHKPICMYMCSNTHVEHTHIPNTKAYIENNHSYFPTPDIEVVENVGRDKKEGRDLNIYRKTQKMTLNKIFKVYV